MAVFEDRNGQSWVVDISVTTLKRLRSHGVDIQEGIGKTGELFDKFLTDPIFLVDMLYVVCQQQAEERSISDEEFGVALGTADAIESATKAFIEGLKSFFPHQAKVITLAIEKLRQVQEKLSEEMIKQMENLNVDEMTKQFGKSLTSALESSASTPDHLP
jgi:hypothetical protein